MELRQSAQTTRSQVASDIGAVRSRSQTLRQIGFHALTLFTRGESKPYAASRLHLLGYCRTGTVRISVRLGSCKWEVLNVRTGDTFFIPSGAACRFENVATGTTQLVIASGYETPDIGDGSNGTPEALMSDVLSQARSSEFDSDLDTLTAHRHDEWIPHVVTFYDRPRRGPGFSRSVEGVFDRELLVREFGVSDWLFPDLSLLDITLSVIRPIEGGSFDRCD